MTEAAATGTSLSKLFDAAARAVGESLRMLIHKPVNVSGGRLSLAAADEFAGSLPAPIAVVRGALDKDYRGKHVRMAFEAKEAAAIAGMLAMAPEEAVADKRRAGLCGNEDLEAFGEVAPVLCSSVESALRGSLPGETGVRFEDCSLVAGPQDAIPLGEGQLAVFSFTLQLASFPPATAFLLVDAETAARWNGGSLDLTDRSGGQPGDAEDADIPAAPVRGRLAVYVADPQIGPTVRKSCRRVGLEFDRRGRAEVPNPAGHRDDVVLIEVPVGDERRFGWCRRIKSFCEQTRVVLLIQHPSRTRVVEGIKAGADAILGWPVSERLLSQKLASLLGTQRA
jgi:hypothetical protein